MTDTTPTQPKDAAVTVTFSVPDEWTINHWQIFSNGQTAYEKRCKANNDAANGMLSDFYGSLALIEAGIVQVKGSDELSAILKRASLSNPTGVNTNVSLAIVGLIQREVALPIFMAMQAPLDFLSN